jgi:hypothetical protein
MPEIMNEHFIRYTGKCRVAVYQGKVSYVILEGIRPEGGKRLYRMQITEEELHSILIKIEEARVLNTEGE